MRRKTDWSRRLGRLVLGAGTVSAVATLLAVAFVAGILFDDAFLQHCYCGG